MRFEDYMSMIAAQFDHADRVGPFRDYCTGPLLPGEGKSVAPMAARFQPRQVRSEHLRLHHFVADASWYVRHSGERGDAWVKFPDSPTCQSTAP